MERNVFLICPIFAVSLLVLPSASKSKAPEEPIQSITTIDCPNPTEDNCQAFSVLNASLFPLIDLYEEKYRLEDKNRAFETKPATLNLPSKNRETYDFIIVGGGTSGCILARRLSEIFKVLLLEAGGDPPPIDAVPYLSQNLRFHSKIHYIYGSKKQSKSGLKDGGIIKSSGGKMLGGSSSHNEGQYERGSPHDYNKWAEDSEDDSWRYENVLKYFKKSEDYLGQFTNGNDQHGTGGLLPVVPGNVGFPPDLWMNAGAELGYEIDVDPNGPQKVAFSPAEYNRYMGRRVSTYSAFVEPVEKETPNLTIRRYSVASEVVFNDKKTYAVKYERHGIPSIAFARNEIILSAGACISPVLLIRSGIGPEDQLELAKKCPVSILPVGYNLQDHVFIGLPPITVTDPSVIKHVKNDICFDDIDEYIDYGTGSLTSDGMHEAFIASNRAKTVDKNAAWADTQLYFLSPSQPNSLSCSVNLNRPYSRGRLYYNATPSKQLEQSLIPIIDYNHFGDESDFDVVLEGISLCQKLVETTDTFKKIGAQFPPRSYPNCQAFSLLGFTQYYKCYIKYNANTNNHMVGTCKMGKPSDPQSVVDSKLRVLGVTGLRVVDASIIPFHVNANICAAVMMIAEKAAEDIINDWTQPQPP